MASLAELKRRLKKVSLEGLQIEMRNIITSDPNVYDAKMYEFERGLTPDLDRIGVYRDVDYAVMKQQMNPLAGGDVDLILTGSFTSQLFIQYLGDSRYQFDSRDSKAPMLFSRNYYLGVNGSVLRGLNKETFDDLQKKLYAPELIRHIKKITNL